MSTPGAEKEGSESATSLGRMYRDSLPRIINELVLQGVQRLDLIPFFRLAKLKERNPE